MKQHTECEIIRKGPKSQDTEKEKWVPFLWDKILGPFFWTTLCIYMVAPPEMPTLRILERNRKIKVGKKQSRGDKIKELRRVIFKKKFSIFHHLNHSAQYSYFKLQNIA